MMNDFVQKDLWLATNFTSKMMRDGKGRNQAIKIASCFYKVSTDDISIQLSTRQSKAQKGKTRGKFKYYVFYGDVTYYNDDHYDGSKELLLCKALNSENARKSFSEEKFLGGKGNHVAGKYISDNEWEENSKEFDSKKDAEQYYVETKNKL